MCTIADFDKVEITKHAIIAYKIVSIDTGKFTSEYIPRLRSKQNGWQKKGEQKTYKIGNRYRSSMSRTPGIYCYADNRKAFSPAGYAMLRVRISIGTKIVRGFHNYTHHATVNAERIIILDQCLP